MVLRDFGALQSVMGTQITLAEIEDLINQFQQHAISVQECCDSFERAWNFEVEKRRLPNKVFEALDFLFDEVALFCPLHREQWTYPRYRDQSDIHAAAIEAMLAIAAAD